MKSTIHKLIFPVILFCFFGINTNAQRCGKKLLCNIELDDRFDYRGQSTYAILYPGDTIRTKIVTYGGQYYDIFTCADPILGAIEFNVIKQDKKYRNVIQEVNETEEIQYKLDDYGDYEYDAYGDFIEIGRETIYDTVWIRERYIEEEIFFNNLNNKDGKDRWQKLARKTQTLIVEVLVPENGQEGCVDLLIGHKTRQKSSFKR